MLEHEQSGAEHDQEQPPERSPRRRDHSGAQIGAVVGAVAIGPLGLPIGAAAGAVFDALKPDPSAPSAHTHNFLLSPCYDGCPAWRHSRK